MADSKQKARERQKRYRDRRRAGLMTLKVVVPDTWPDMLAQVGLLLPHEADDVALVEQATAEIIGKLSE